VAVNIDGPQTVAPGEAVKVRVTVTNVSGEPTPGLRLEVRNATEGGLRSGGVQAAGDCARRGGDRRGGRRHSGPAR